jgi:hypothetical protein
MGTLGKPFFMPIQMRVKVFMSRLSDESIFSSRPMSVAECFDMTLQLLDHVSSAPIAFQCSKS